MYEFLNSVIITKATIEATGSYNMRYEVNKFKTDLRVGVSKLSQKHLKSQLGDIEI